MMLFEIINPSDKYTFHTDNIKVATAVNVILGEGRYGLEQLDAKSDAEKFNMPIFLMGGHEQWFKENFNTDVAQLIDDVIENHLDEIISAFDDVIIGNRSAYDLAINHIKSPEEIYVFKSEWLDKYRSSLNNIGKNADIFANHFRKIKAGIVNESNSQK